MNVDIHIFQGGTSPNLTKAYCIVRVFTYIMLFCLYYTFPERKKWVWPRFELWNMPDVRRRSQMSLIKRLKFRRKKLCCFKDKRVLFKYFFLAKSNQSLYQFKRH